jgi:hypothetical protein
MTFKIDLSKMKHLKEKSCYNYNFYSYGNYGIELLQVCDEEANMYIYYLVNGDNKVLLGCSDDDEEYIEFMTLYT